MSLRELVAMGAYGAYIWSCYALTVVVLIWSAWSARRHLRNEIVAARRRVAAQNEMLAEVQR